MRKLREKLTQRIEIEAGTVKDNGFITFPEDYFIFQNKKIMEKKGSRMGIK
jgi:hypothetical protein